jgi:hypothetical protein
MKNKFESLVERLNINPAILSEINSWEYHSDLKKLFNKLHSVNNQQSFLDHLAEAMVARHLIKRGWALEVEVQTPQGRSVDFRAAKNNYTLCVHIKRLNLEQKIQNELRIITRLQRLRKISRPCDLIVDLSKRLTDKEMQELYKQAKSFIEHSQVGDRRIIKNSDGKILAKCEKSPKFNGRGKNVEVNVLPILWPVRDRERLYEILSEAYKQFMPKSLNIILVTSRLAMVFNNFKKSLFDSRGFWSNDKHPDSYMVGWFYFNASANYIKFKIYYRDGRKVPEEIRNLFEDKMEDPLTINDKKPEDVLKPEFLEKYKEHHKDIWFQLSQINTTITILEKILQSPLKYFPKSETIFWQTVCWNFVRVSVVFIHAMVNDRSSDANTLPRHKNNIRSWLKDSERKEFDLVLRKYKFDQTTKNILTNITNIRKKVLAHRLFDNNDILSDPGGITVSEIRHAYNSIENIFHACSFGVEHDTTLYPTGTSGGKPIETDIDKLIDLIVKNSNWLNRPELMKEHWPDIRQGLSKEQLRDLNTWRERFCLPPA